MRIVSELLGFHELAVYNARLISEALQLFIRSDFRVWASNLTTDFT